MITSHKRFAFSLFMLFVAIASNAQCAMCRAALGSSEGTIKAEAVNNGIVYLMIFPYLLVGLAGYAVYRLRKNSKDKNTQQ